MRSRLLFVVAAVAASTACAVNVRRAPDAPEAARATTAIRGALDSTAAGWNRGDLAGYMSMYDDSVTSNGADAFLTGKAGVETVMRRGFWRTGRPLQQLRYENVVVAPLGPDHALVTGRFVLTGVDRSDRTGLFTTVWRRNAAGWRMIHDHSG